MHKISFQNYDIIRTDRPNSIQGGGTAIAIKRNIRYTNINLQALTNSEIIETTVIKLNLTDGVSMYIIAAYAAGNHKKEFHLEFAKIFRYLKLEAPNNYYVIAGDLNAKHQHWKNNTCNPRGTFLFNWLRENDIKYKACLRSTDIPSFPRGNSYIDICIADCRLEFHNTDKDGNLRCLPYDSDHNAISMTISKENDTLFTLEENNISHSLNYRRTDWDKFRRVLNKDCRIEIPRDRNLSNHEINSYLTAMNEVIKKAIHSTVPKIKHRDSMEAYSNERIRDIQKTKSFLITRINRAYRRFEYHDNPELTMLKDTLLEVKQKLKQEYSISINKYWRKKIDDIPKNDPENMFPIINRIFRPRGKAAIANLQIPENNTDLLERAGIDIKTLSKNQSNNYIIAEPKDKLNVIGAHFEKIHTQNSEMGKKASIIQEQLEKAFHEVLFYCDSWKLKINTSKCETILFRPRLDKANRDVKKNWKNFSIKKAKDLDDKIPHKTTVKYLGVYIDTHLTYRHHMYEKLEKARKGFQKLGRLMHNTHLDPKIKVNCYLTIIRPILTYGSPIWFNQNAATMEKIRSFERKCLRACLGKYRTADSNYQKYISNAKLYDLANTSRIDTHILKLNRDHFANTRKVTSNSLISAITYPNESYFKKTLKTGYIPPEAFIYLDKMGYIQDNNNVPILYHIGRNARKTTIEYDQFMDSKNQSNCWVYKMTLPKKDRKDQHRRNAKKYWWLGD
ncbi:hypothetical protein M0802_016735 [Mischocyttarus mexicanus]|nr:hypothetical protein M0802_016735 [Mischocyttarus mexicanus]